MRRLAALTALLAGVLAPAAQAERMATGPADLRVRDGRAVVEAADGSWRVWDLRKGRLGPRHALNCGTSRILDHGRDAGPRGVAYIAVTLERREQAVDAQGVPVGPPPRPLPGPEDPLCKPVRAVLDRDGDGRSAPGVVAVLRLTGLGRYPTALPLLQLPAGQTASGLWVVGGDVWLALEGGTRYVSLRARAKRWGSRVTAARRPAAVDPPDTGGVTLLDDGALWRWSWADLSRRGRVTLSKGSRRRYDRRPRTVFTVTNPTPGYRPAEPRACRSPRRVTTGGPASALVDGRGRGGWGISDGELRWRCRKGKNGIFSRVDVHWLMRTADGGRSWRLAGRHPVQAPLVGLLGAAPVFEQGASSSCPRRLVVRRKGRLREIRCAA